MTDHARSTRPRAVGRALLGLAMVCAAGAGWWGWRVQNEPDPDQVTLDVETAVATVTPSTVAPLGGTPSQIDSTDEPNDGADTEPPMITTPTTPPATVPLSPLAEILGPVGSAIPPVVEARVRPSALVIPAIDVLRPVRAVGLEDNGELEVPDETEIGWYQYGATPGRAGATVLAAHVTWNRNLGPFYRLGELDPGDQIDVVLDDDSTRVYEVVERTIYGKNELPRWRIWRNSGPESLVLITCGGSYNPDIRRYRENIVVYAVPVGQIDAPDERAET